MKSNYDIVILGAGVGGIIAALKARKKGFSVALIEKDELGGASFNWGALPFQELIHVAKTYRSVKGAAGLGIQISGGDTPLLNWKMIQQNAMNRARGFKGYIEDLLEKKGVDLLKGKPTLHSVNEIEIAGKVIECEDLVIATGSSYALPSFVAKGSTNFYTPKNFLKIGTLPSEVTIVGGGLIGMEYALLLSALDVKVTVVEKDEKLMSYLDSELYKSLVRDIYYSNIDLKLGCKAISFENGKLTVDDNGSEKVIACEAFISGLTREPNLDGLEKLVDSGLKLRKGYIHTDTLMRTTLPHVYAVGDVNGRALLAHVAAKEAETLMNYLAGEAEELVYELLHYNMYAMNQMASVGMTEDRAHEAGFLVATSKFFLNGAKDQFVRVVYDKKSEEVLGVHIYAENATDLICEALYVMEKSETVEDFSRLVHSHPIHSMEIVDQMIKG